MGLFLVSGDPDHIGKFGLKIKPVEKRENAEIFTNEPIPGRVGEKKNTLNKGLNNQLLVPMKS